jgi:hypothetical protein
MQATSPARVKTAEVTRASDPAPRRIGAALCLNRVGPAVFWATVGSAHTASAPTVIARISADDMKKAVDVVSVTTDPNLERLLIVHVGKRWHETDERLRRHVAEEWLHLWKDAVPNGIVGIVNESNGNSLVGFDVDGKATLREHGGSEADSAAD